MNFYRPIWSDATFDRLYDQLCRDVSESPQVNTGHWQAKKDVPMTLTRELRNVVLELPIAASPGAWASWMRPNMPWAEDHFQERVSGYPHNPPPSHVNWPYNQAENKDHMDGEWFSHTYPERLWPKHAPLPMADRPPLQTQSKSKPGYNFGIRYEYGDLGNAVDLLVQEPHTRQCYIPIWFPEDLHAAAVQHQRVPCTLGYHAMLRERKLHLFYPMRSLDLLRYARDDFYMAGRLTHWLIEECRNASHENSIWHEVQPGLLTVHAVSLHCFDNDIPIIRHMLEKKRKRVAA